ncbi:MAG: hypothetical protein HN658_04310, partial [Rhodospirillales bacterium]|nr:hypothetical protein [Rhodospirillales bacterium]
MAAPTSEQRIAIFERMIRMRRFEEEVLRIAQDHPYAGRQHLYIGHEATGAAVAQVLAPEDLLHSTHRNHGYLIARGANLGKAMAE